MGKVTPSELVEERGWDYVEHLQRLADDIKAIAELPSRDELIAKLLFLLQSPIIRVVRGLGASTRDFVVVLEQIRQQKE